MLLTLVFLFGGAGELSQGKLFGIVKHHGAQFDKAIQAGDLDQLVAIYSKNATYLAEGTSIHNGQGEIREAWSQTLSVMRRLSLEPVKVSAHGDSIVEIGTGKTLMELEPGKSTWIPFKYVNIWVRQEDGSYKLDVDVYKFME